MGSSARSDPILARLQRQLDSERRLYDDVREDHEGERALYRRLQDNINDMIAESEELRCLLEMTAAPRLRRIYRHNIWTLRDEVWQANCRSERLERNLMRSRLHMDQIQHGIGCLRFRIRSRLRDLGAQDNKPDTERSTSATQWRARCAPVLEGKYASLTAFPDPPNWPCGKRSCEMEMPNRALKACKCNIAELFRRLNVDARTERLKWHPDRFSKCPETQRAGFQAKASEIFIVLEKLHRADRD